MTETEARFLDVGTSASPAQSAATETHTLAQLDPLQSATFKIARVLCIFFMTSAHAWPGAARLLDAQTSLVSQAFFFLIVDVLGKASVPLLSLISGLLFVLSFGRRGAVSVLLGKVQTLLIPMVAWSLPMIVILYLEPLATGGTQPSWNTMDWTNALFSITTSPANGPLHFFRDIFVMVLYGAFVMALFGRHPIAGIILAIGIALIEQKSGGLFIFRNQIAFMFMAGMILALLHRVNWRPSWKPIAAAFGAYCVVWQLGWVTSDPQPLLQQRLGELIPRIAVSLLMWRLASETVCRLPQVRQGLSSLEPHIFVVFCSHALTAKLFALVAAILSLSENAWYMPAFLIVQLVTFVIVGVTLSHVLKPFPLLRGKPLGRERQGS